MARTEAVIVSLEDYRRRRVQANAATKSVIAPQAHAFQSMKMMWFPMFSIALMPVMMVFPYWRPHPIRGIGRKGV